MVKTSWTKCVGLLIIIAVIRHSSQQEATPEEALLKVLSAETYNNAVKPPTVNNSALPVQAGLMLSAIGDINEMAMEVSVTLVLRLRWRDPRLVFSGIYGGQEDAILTAGHARLPWQPDVFIANAMAEFKDPAQKTDEAFVVSSNGSVMYSKRINAKLTNTLDFHNFPLDKQEFYIRLESFAYKKTTLDLEWFEDTPVETPEQAFLLPRFHVKSVTTETCSAVVSTGEFPCLSAKLDLKRRHEHFVLQIYIPMVLVVILSWVSFWINVDAAPARVSIGLLTVLTITTQATNANKSLPDVAYLKLIDVFVSGSYVVAALSLLEYALICVLTRRDARRCTEEKLALQEEEDMKGNGNRNSHKAQMSIDTAISRATARCYCDRYERTTAEKVDMFCRFAFPALYLLFNILFWIWGTSQ